MQISTRGFNNLVLCFRGHMVVQTILPSYNWFNRSKVASDRIYVLENTERFTFKLHTKSKIHLHISIEIAIFIKLCKFQNFNFKRNCKWQKNDKNNFISLCLKFGQQSYPVGGMKILDLWTLIKIFYDIYA